jgi:tRNASer (uridine44-2'-O)-methyltransferase
VAEIVARVAALCLAEETAGGPWRRGSSLALGEVVAALGQAGVQLSRLKAECGGLQTLLRNHHSVFLVAGGRVRIRVPGEDPAPARRGAKAKEEEVHKHHKTRPCWHHTSHPDGCPLPADRCSWLHPEGGPPSPVEAAAQL